MAVIGTIRKQSGLLVIIVGVALAAFVLGDFLKPRSGARVVNVAEVEGEQIPFSVFDARLEQNLEAAKRNQNKTVLTPEEEFNIRQQTLDQLIQSMVLKNEYEKLGLKVTADEMFNLIQGDNPHPYITQYFKDPQTQQYDPELVRRYISQLDLMDPASRTQWNEFVDAIEEDQYQRKYKNLIKKGYYMPDTFLVFDFNDKKTLASARLVSASFATVADSLVNPTDEDFEKYYKEYGYRYKQEESRDLKYVIFNVTPSVKDRKNIRDDVFAIFEDFKTADNIPLFVNSESETRYDSSWFKKGELPVRIDTAVFNGEPGKMVPPYIENEQWHMARLIDVSYRPDSMKASHILITYRGAFRAPDTLNRTREEAKAMADSILNVVKRNPAKMEELAVNLSDDPSAKENKGDLGWFADGAMVYPFNQAVLEHKVGEYTVAESQFGFHVIKVTGKTDEVKKVRVAQIDISITPSQETFQDVYAKASEFQGNATDLEAFDTLAPKFNVSVRSATFIRPMSNRIAGITSPRQIIRWAYGEGIDVGSVSYVFTMDDSYVVAAVEKVHEEGIPPLEDFKDMIEPLVVNELKGDVIMERFRAVMEETSDIAQIAEKMESQVDTVYNLNFLTRNLARHGNESKIIAKIFTSEIGQLTGPVKGDNNAMAFIVDDFIYPDPSEDNKIYRRQLEMNFQAKVNNNSFLDILVDQYDVTDNRIRFF